VEYVNKIIGGRGYEFHSVQLMRVLSRVGVEGKVSKTVHAPLIQMFPAPSGSFFLNDYPVLPQLTLPPHEPFVKSSYQLCLLLTAEINRKGRFEKPVPEKYEGISGRINTEGAPATTSGK